MGCEVHGAGLEGVGVGVANRAQVLGACPSTERRFGLVSGSFEVWGVGGGMWGLGLGLVVKGRGLACSLWLRLAGTVTGTMRRAAHPSGCARCGAGAGCSAIKYQSLEGCGSIVMVL